MPAAQLKSIPLKNNGLILAMTLHENKKILECNVKYRPNGAGTRCEFLAQGFQPATLFWYAVSAKTDI
ncbi:hypothetical protein FDZ73_09480 [bacterium]|nr:MAG: hypothetical protein FDZ73_09480 [bacterium]